MEKRMILELDIWVNEALPLKDVLHLCARLGYHTLEEMEESNGGYTFSSKIEGTAKQLFNLTNSLWRLSYYKSLDIKDADGVIISDLVGNLYEIVTAEKFGTWSRKALPVKTFNWHSTGSNEEYRTKKSLVHFSEGEDNAYFEITWPNKRIGHRPRITLCEGESQLEQKIHRIEEISKEVFEGWQDEVEMEA